HPPAPVGPPRPARAAWFALPGPAGTRVPGRTRLRCSTRAALARPARPAHAALGHSPAVRASPRAAAAAMMCG
ncbi:hypothetical protein ACWDZX_20420, partial [Streptomyces collinus]